VGLSERPAAANAKEAKELTVRASAASGCGSATTVKRATRSRAINDSEGSATEAAACRDRRDGAGAAPLSPFDSPAEDLPPRPLRRYTMVLRHRLSTPNLTP